MFGRARDHSDAANVLTIKPFDISDDDNRKKNSLQISFFRSLLELATGPINRLLGTRRLSSRPLGPTKMTALAAEVR